MTRTVSWAVAGTVSGVNASPLLSRPGAVESAHEPSVAWHYGDPFAEQRAATSGSILLDGWGCGSVMVSGPDRLSWLHALASADFASLGPGAATEALWLSARGHVEHWAAATVTADAAMLRTESADDALRLAEFLESRRFRAAVSISDMTAQTAYLGVLSVGSDTHYRAVPRADFSAAAATLIAAGSVPAGTWARDALAVAARAPRFGSDNDARTVPNEVPQWMRTAIDMGKGCYCGQETVARIANIGAPPRRLVLLNIDGSGQSLPAAGDDVRLADGDAVVGRVGTVAQHWEDGPIALALVKRTVAPGVPLIAGGVAALIDPADTVPPGPKTVYRKSDFIDLRALRQGR